MTGNDIFRQRLQISVNQAENRTGKGASRCLFGTPNPVENHSVENAVFSKNRWCFERHWNFNMEETLSTTHPIVPVKKPELKISEAETNNKFQWSTFYDEDYMAGCDSHRTSAPIAPNTRSVSLFFAPVVPVKSEPETAATAEVDAINSPVNLTDNPDIVPNTQDRLPSPPCIDNHKVKEELLANKDEIKMPSQNTEIANEVSPISRLVTETETVKHPLPSPPLTESNLQGPELKSPKFRTSSTCKHNSNSDAVMSSSNSKRLSSRCVLVPNLSSELRLRSTKSHGVINKADSPIHKVTTVHHIGSGQVVLAKRRSIIDYMRMKKFSRGKRI